MIFSAYTLYDWFKKSIDPRRQNWPLHSSKLQQFRNFTHSTHSTFQWLRAFHSLRYTSFASLHFIRFALLHSFRFASLHSLRSFRSLRSTHSVSLHSFRFTPLISLTSPYERCHSFHFVKFLHCFRFDSFHWNSAFRVVSHERDKCFWWRLNHLNLKFTSYNNITIQVSSLKYLLIKTSLLLLITV